MVDRDLGQATIAYEDPGEETVEKTVENEHVAYFQDHWIVKTDESEAGHDVIRRIPAGRVHYVERSVEEFEQEVQTLRDQVQSFADDLRSRFLGGGDEGQGDQSDVRRVEVETGEESRGAGGSRSGQHSDESGSGGDDGESGNSGGESESDDEEWSGDEDDEVEGGPGRGGEGP